MVEVQVAMLGERVNELEEQIVKMDKALGDAFDRIRALEWRPFPSETRPGAIVTVRPKLSE